MLDSHGHTHTYTHTHKHTQKKHTKKNRERAEVRLPWFVQEKEVWSRETITSLRREIDNLNELVEKGADLAMQLQMQEPGG